MNNETTVVTVIYKDKTLEQIHNATICKLDSNGKFIQITQLLDNGKSQTIMLNVNIVDKVVIAPKE